jgi:Ca-activated chloride channel family protein
MTPDPIGFHFAYPLWLWALLLPPLLWLLSSAKRQGKDLQKRFQRYADAHLLPHLVLHPEEGNRRQRRHLLMWSLIWCLGILAMANPRWDATEVQVFQASSDLVILLDLSHSMNVTDVKPSRLGRARQEVADLLNLGQGIRVGLVAFATFAHAVAPITEDKRTLLHLLPSLSTDLFSLKGSRLSTAIDRSRRLLTGQPPGNSRALLLISDGDFDEPNLLEQIKALQAENVQVYVLGIGLPTGGQVPDFHPGEWMRNSGGQVIVSLLNEAQLRDLAKAGGGFYVKADYHNEDTKQLLERIQADTPPRLKENPITLWHERFYWLVGLMLLLVLSRFRRGSDAIRSGA